MVFLYLCIFFYFNYHYFFGVLCFVYFYRENLKINTIKVSIFYSKIYFELMYCFFSFVYCLFCI
jgi:hypothetical protein